MSTLAPSARLKLARVLNLLGSPVDGEVVAAGRAAHRLLRDAGLHSFEEVIPTAAEAAPERTRSSFDARGTLTRLAAMADELSPWEWHFVSSLRAQVERGRPLSAKQIGKLLEISDDHR